MIGPEHNDGVLLRAVAPERLEQTVHLAIQETNARQIRTGKFFPVVHSLNRFESILRQVSMQVPGKTWGTVAVVLCDARGNERILGIQFKPALCRE